MLSRDGESHPKIKFENQRSYFLESKEFKNNVLCIKPILQGKPTKSISASHSPKAPEGSR